MRSMFRAVLVTLVVAATLVVKAQSAATTTTPTAVTPVKLGTVEIIPRGARQFTVKVSFDVPYDMFGWFVHLVLDKPVDTLETSEADVTKRSGTEFDLSSEDWNRYLYAGNHLVITLVGNLTSNGTAIPSGGCTELRHTLRDPADLHTCSIVSSANVPSVVPEDECDDHVDGRITCDKLPNFCAVDYAKILCRRFCGLCKEEHGCNFEQSMCTWLPDSRPLFLNWTRISAFRGGLMEGPERDHTFHTASGSYMLATSEGANLGQQAVLKSQQLPHNTSFCLQLWHNVPAGRLAVYREVSGVRMELLEEVRASHDAENTAKLEPWTKLTVNIPAFWTDYSVILVATPGDNKGPPLTIDDVSLREGACAQSETLIG